MLVKKQQKQKLFNLKPGFKFGYSEETFFMLCIVDKITFPFLTFKCYVDPTQTEGYKKVFVLNSPRFWKELYPNIIFYEQVL